MIERELGQGGMATVYLARDVRHHRRVALKVLRPELAAVIGAERFLKEIETTANLQHPHILPLFDSGHAEGAVFYVMPYVEGESLRDRLIRERQLPIDDALRIARDVADALDYAHRHGVIHRDIKPENVLLHDGRALVADFGIALAVATTGATRMTETGMSLGTPMYMSPEQAMGERVLDARTDIYALACVVHEMLVGEPPFTGPTAQAIVAKVITERPARVTALRDTVPPHVEDALQKALAKLPADRFTTAKEFADAMAETRAVPRYIERAPPVPVATPQQIPRARIMRIAPWVVAAAMAALALQRGTGADAIPAGATTRFAVPVPRASGDSIIALNTVSGAFGLSPDGRKLVILAGDPPRLFVRSLDSLTTNEVPSTTRAQWPVFSRDGAWLLFQINSVLFRASASGGQPEETSVKEVFTPPEMDVDGTLYFTAAYNTGLFRLEAGSRTPDSLTAPDTAKRELGHWFPQLLPGGEALLFTNFSLPLSRSKIEVLSLRDGRRTVVLEGATFARYAGGYLFFTNGGNILAVPFDTERLSLSGAPVAVVRGVASYLTNGTAAFAVSPNGTMVYAPAASNAARRQLVWVDRKGLIRPVLDSVGGYLDPALSPDGRRIAFGLQENGATNLWVLDPERMSMTRLTNVQSSTQAVIWTPDGEELWYTQETPVFDILRRRANAASPEQIVHESRTDKYITQIAPGGREYLLTLAPSGPTQIAVVPMGRPAAMRTLSAPGVSEAMASVSPDGHWLVYQSNESGRTEVYLRSYPDLTRVKVQISTRGGMQPRWTRGGREVVYLEENAMGRRMMSANVNLATGGVGTPVQLFAGPFKGDDMYAQDYDVTADGERFLMVRFVPSAAPPEFVVTVNWFKELDRRFTPER